MFMEGRMSIVSMRKAGFTLVELIAVIIILGILAAVGMPQYRRAMERARGAEAYSGLANVQESEKIYYASNEAYYPQSPLDDTGEGILDISLPQTGWTFSISSTDTAVDFTAVATRAAGPCANDTIQVDNRGTITDSWKTCVDGL